MADKMKKAVEEAKEQTAKVAEDVKEQTAKAVVKAKEQTAKVVEDVKEQTAPVVEKAKRRGRKAAEKTAETAAKAKDAVEKAAKKVVTGEVAPVVYVQYMGDEKKVEDLVDAAKAAFAVEHKGTRITDLKLYVKPEDRAAYYVVNEQFAGRVEF